MIFEGGSNEYVAEGAYIEESGCLLIPLWVICALINRYMVEAVQNGSLKISPVDFNEFL